jgi:uncharacterized SAM-binding protein YcdF (DUF218 family)
MLKLIAVLSFLLFQAVPAPPGVTEDIWTNYKSIPTSNTDAKHFDAIIVLGVPTEPDGSIAPEAQARMTEGIREYKAGVASHLIPTGGQAHNEYFEAHAMKEFAVSQGVPADAVIEEGQAKDTIQNIWFSYKIMQAHNWHSAEVVSSPSHLPRTALILQHYKDLKWRTHPSLWPESFDQAHIDKLFTGESKGCWTLTHDGFRPNDFLPGS